MNSPSRISNRSPGSSTDAKTSSTPTATHTNAGIEILDLIDSYDHPDPTNCETPPRSLAARRAAALYALLFDGRALAPKTIDITIDEATRRGEWADDLSSIRSDVTGYGPVPPSWIRPWLIDAALRRVVTNGSEILDLGRTTRLANRANAEPSNTATTQRPEAHQRCPSPELGRIKHCFAKR